jgi:hypothetical protein
MATRWMPPDRSIDQDTASGVVGLTLLITASSASVKSLSQPSFFSTPRRELRVAVLDLGVLRVIAVAEQADLALAAVGERFSRSRPKRARNVPPTFLDRKVGVVEQRRARDA